MKLLSHSSSRRNKITQNGSTNTTKSTSSNTIVSKTSPSSSSHPTLAANSINRSDTSTPINGNSNPISNTNLSKTNTNTTSTPHSRSSSLRSHSSFQLSSNRNANTNTNTNSTPSPSNIASPNNSSLSIQALSSVSPILFSKSSHSTIIHHHSRSGYSSNNNSPSFINDTQRIELSKKMESSFSKFSNLKKNNTLKANILRLNLLPNLRYPIKPFKDVNELLATSILELNIDLLFIETKILLNWWSDLLNILLLDFQSVSSLDRNCYFESISRLFSHNIWLLVQSNLEYSQTFMDIYETYKKLLLQTFEFAILRLNSKTVSVSISIFIGKVFSYSFFHLNDISKGLSFLLNTKLINFKKIYNLCIYNSFTNLNSNYINNFPNILNDLIQQFPSHMGFLINSTSQPRNVNYIIESQFMNSNYPPREKINGIRETKGTWVNRWCSLENISIFCSFMRNYLTLASIYMKNFPLMMIDQYYIFGMPGFLTFLTQMYQIFSLQLKNLSIKNMNSNTKLKAFSNNIVYNENNLLTINPKVSNESNIDKCFNILRDLLINPRNPNERLLKSGVIKGYENILKLFVKKTKILDTFMIETLLNLFVQFCKTIDATNDNNLNLTDLNHSNHSLIDWYFWLDILVILLDSNNLNCEVKSISTLYQIWDYIPNDIYAYLDDNNNNNISKKHWIVDHTDHLKMNIIQYLLSTKNWFKFMGHYTSLERNLFIKFVIWRLLGISSSFENLITFQDFKLKNTSDDMKIKEIIDLRLAETYMKTKTLIFKPNSLLMRKKFTINKTLGSDLKKREKKLRTYPFEVLDDAVYTAPKQSQSTQSSSHISRSTSTGSLSEKYDPKSNKAKNKHKHKSGNWMGRIFSKSQSSIDVSKQKQATTENGKGFGKLLSMSRSNSERKESSQNQSPISSLSSSLSSLELNNNFNNGQFNNHQTDNENGKQNVMYPPEWEYDLDIEKENYEFNLVDDEGKLYSFIQQLNGLNGGTDFTGQGELLITNDSPRLPSIRIDPQSVSSVNVIQNNNVTHSRLNMDSLESIVDENEGAETDKDDGFLSNDLLIDDELIDLNGGFDTEDVEGIDLNLSENNPTYGYKTGTLVYYDGTDPIIKKRLIESNKSASLVYLANGLLEYNEEIIKFEKFLTDRVNELDPTDLTVIDDLKIDRFHPHLPHPNNTTDTATSSSSFLEIPVGKGSTMRDINESLMGAINAHTYKLSTKGFLKLKRDIPSIVPDIQNDKLNAY